MESVARLAPAPRVHGHAQLPLQADSHVREVLAVFPHPVLHAFVCKLDGHRVGIVGHEEEDNDAARGRRVEDALLMVDRAVVVHQNAPLAREAVHVRKLRRRREKTV